MKETVTVLSNKKLTKDIFEMKLSGNTEDIKRPGQFINIKLEGFFLRRPISICDYDEESITIIYKVVGEGTKVMSEMNEGVTLDILSGLGNGFDIEKGKGNILVVGGGVGVPPMYGLTKRLVKKGIYPKVIMGFNSAEDVFYEDEFKALGIEPIIATADGTKGVKGFVTDAMKTLSYDYVYTCGPEAMLKAMDSLVPDGQFSFEARMACGFGACMGCSCETKYGYKRICKDGPVLFKEEIKW